MLPVTPPPKGSSAKTAYSAAMLPAVHHTGSVPDGCHSVRKSGSGGDYPRGYEVLVARKKDAWGEPVAKGKGTGTVVDVDFDPVNCRYLKIVQTGSHDTYWWSIHELTVKMAPAEGSGDK